MVSEAGWFGASAVIVGDSDVNVIVGSTGVGDAITVGDAGSREAVTMTVGMVAVSVAVGNAEVGASGEGVLLVRLIVGVGVGVSVGMGVTIVARIVGDAVGDSVGVSVLVDGGISMFVEAAVTLYSTCNSGAPPG